MSQQVPAPPRPQDTDAPPPSRLPMGRLVVGVLLVLLGVLWLLDAAGVTDLRWQVVLPAALTVVGVALIASARRDSHGGLVTAGIILTVLVLLSAMVPGTVPVAGVGDQTERPTGLADVEDDYSLAMGSLTVDLRDVEDLADGTAVSASVGMGELVVILPADVGGDIEASSGIGEVTVLGASQGGLGVSVTERVSGEPSIDLELSVGIGRVEVRR